MEVYGIAGTGSPDKIGEILNIEGADIDDLTIFNDEHKEGCFATLGQVKSAKKIFRPEDCEDKFQINCWNHVKEPFIYVHGAILDNEHPNATAARELIKYSIQNPDFPIGLSVEGATLARRGKVLDKTKVVSASLTVKPMNDKCRLFPVNNLMKSDTTLELPNKYKDKESRRSFRNLPTLEKRLEGREKLFKSMLECLKSSDNMENVGYMKCWNCGEGTLVMKNRIPNRCPTCNEGFTMQDIYKAKIG